MAEARDNPESDHELVCRAQKGEVDAYDLLMLRHQDGIASQMRRFSPSREVVEDSTQTVFVEAYQSLSDYAPIAPFVHWLRTIASRVGYKYWRGEERRVKLVPYQMSDMNEMKFLRELSDVSRRLPGGIGDIRSRVWRQLDEEDELATETSCSAIMREANFMCAVNMAAVALIVLVSGLVLHSFRLLASDAFFNYATFSYFTYF